jgi:Ca2+-binding RTX toxin-like protein
VDVDLATLVHMIQPGQDAGGRFTVVPNGIDFQGNTRFSLVVAPGGTPLLDYEAIQTPVDNQYQVVVDTYSDTIANGGLLVASRQFTVFLNDVSPEIVTVAPTDIQWNGIRPGEGTPLLGNLGTGLPGAGTVIANLQTTDADTSSGFVYSLAAGSAPGFTVTGGVVTRTGSAMAANTTYTLHITSTDTTGAARTETFTVRTGTNSVLFGASGNDTINADATDNVVYGSGGNDTINGLGGNDNLFGQAGNDTLNGGAGNDILVGGAGTDAVNGDAGNDTIRHAVGDGGGAVNGGADSDTLHITANGGDQALTVTFNGTSLINFDGGTVTNVESVTADLGAGTGDTLTYTNSASVTVNLALGTASGFASIANIENVTGNGASDNFTGNAAANQLSGGGAADVLDGGAGNDTLTGGAGADILIGGLGNDVFDFNQFAEMGVGVGNRDVIQDFLGGGGAEDIDLSTLDANTGTLGNGTFSNILGADGAAFTAAGQLRFTRIDTNGDSIADSTLIRGNVDANLATTEFEILLQNYTGAIGAGDFVL